MHGWHRAIGSPIDPLSWQVLDAQVKPLTDCYWHTVDRKEADVALWAEAPIGWSRETLPKDLADGKASAAICIVLFIICSYIKLNPEERWNLLFYTVRTSPFHSVMNSLLSKRLGKIMPPPNWGVLLWQAQAILRLWNWLRDIQGAEAQCCCCAGIILPFFFFFFLK